MDATNRFYEDAAKDGGPRRGQSVGDYWLSLSYDKGRPRQYYLSVDNGDGLQISVRELLVPLSLHMWFLNNGYNFPIVKNDELKKIMHELIESATERDEPPPMLRTDAEHIENLTRYFSIHIPSAVRAYGMEFRDGKVGDIVRMKEDLRRIYFKWQRLKDHLQRMSIRDQHITGMRTFLVEKGGYQDEKTDRGWFRCTLWIPMDLFDEVTLERWMNPDEVEG